ncbi:cupin domain-containing protein [Halorutilales archaeon Cl-col2-1]
MSVEITDLSELPDERSSRVFGSEVYPKTVRIKLSEGEELPPHRHEGYKVVVHIVSGRLAAKIGDESYILEEDDVATFEGGKAVSLEAEIDSSLLVVLCKT